MALSNDLVSQFVRVTNDRGETKKETTIVYGVAKKIHNAVTNTDEVMVMIDGSDTWTPVSHTVDVIDGERVTVMIKNHTATVTGNISAPSARKKDIDSLQNDSDRITVVENLIAEKVDTKDFNAQTGRIDSLVSDNVLVKENLYAQNAEIVTLKSDNVTIKEQLTAANADIDDLEVSKLDAGVAAITYATIVDLQATNAEMDVLQTDVADIDTLIFGSATGDVIQTSFSNAVIAQLGNAQIKSAMIESVSASKIIAGDIITNHVRVMSEDGSLIISDETMQISDDTRVRVQIGKDAIGDYSINIWDDAGNLMFSKGGITDNAIKEAIIRNDMVSDTANIAAHKLDIDSLFEEINGSTNVIKSTQIYLDDESQTLNLAFKTLETEVDNLGTSVTSQGTDISVIQGQIASKIWMQDINDASGEMFTQYSTLSQDLSGFKTTVANTYATKAAFESLEIGGINLLRNTRDPEDTSYWQQGTVVLDDDLDENVFCIKTSTDKEITAGTHRIRVEPGESYTISAYVKRTSNVKSFDFFFLSRSEGNATDFEYIQSKIGFAPPVGEWVKYSWTFVMHSSAYEGYVRIDNNGSSDGTEAILYYTKIKMEKGDKATDWSPAPEDLAKAKDLSGLTTRVSTAETTIKQNTESIELKASKTEVSNAINNISIGGRNLIRDSKLDANTDMWSLDYNHQTISFEKGYLEISRVYDANYINRTFTNQDSYINPLLIPDEISNKTYVLQAELKAIDGITPSAQSSIFWRVYYDNSTSYDEITLTIPEDLSSTEWRRCYATRTFGNQNWTNSQVTIALANSDNGFCVRNIMLERATKPSTWLPAPEDMATAYELGELETRMSTAETSISQNSKEIELKASKTEVTKAIDDLEIGGRNLIVNSSKYRKSSPFSNTSSAVDGTKTETTMYMPVEPGETYTFQCCTDAIWGDHRTDGTGTGWTHIYLYLMTDNTSVGQFVNAVALQNDPSKNLTGRQTWTYTVPNNGTAYTKIMFRFDIHSNGSTSHTANWWDMKAERGTKATDWTPPPEDIETRVSSAETKITQNSDSITGVANRTTSNENKIASLELTADGLTAKVNAAKKQLYHSATGTSGTSGYVGICTLKISNNYQNRPILFELANRGQVSSNISVCFSNTNNTDPTLYHIQSDGGINSWICKTDTSTWSLIIQKSESYDTIYVTDFTNNNASIAVTWTNTHYDALPTTNITAATRLAGKLAKSVVDDAAKTATNYLNFSALGLVVGDHTGSSLGKNVLIDSDSVDIRNGSTVLASFGANMITLGQNAENSIIDLCDGAGKITTMISETENSYPAYDSIAIESQRLNLIGKRIYLSTAYTDSDEDDTSHMTLMSDTSGIGSEHTIVASGVTNKTGVSSAATNNYVNTYTKVYATGWNATAGEYINNSVTVYPLRTQFSRPISVQYNGLWNDITGANKVLWTGGYYMSSGHSCTLSEGVHDQTNGIVLIFSEFIDGAVSNTAFHPFFVPKETVVLHSGVGHCFQMASSNLAYYATKYLYISNTKITGNDNNTLTGASTSGITRTCNRFVLRYVIGV